MKKMFNILSVLLVSQMGYLVQAQDAQSVYSNSVNSVFTIITKDETGETSGLGSGFVYGKGNWIVTNWHVLKGAKSVSVIPANNTIEYPVRGVVIADAILDIAVIELKGAYRTQLMPSSLQPKVGQKVFAIGSPKGLTATFSEGMISAIRGNDLQTTAPISPGSSGGPLLDIWGRVVGMNTKQLSEGQNLNFAIPISTVDAVMKNIDGTILSFEKANEVYNTDEEIIEEEEVSEEQQQDETNAYLLIFGTNENQHKAILMNVNTDKPIVYVKYKGGMIKETCHYTDEKDGVFAIACSDPIDANTNKLSSNYKADIFILYKHNGVQKMALTDGTTDRKGNPILIDVEKESLTPERLKEVVLEFVK